MSRKVHCNKKYITRTFNLKTGTEWIPDYEHGVLDSSPVTLVDWNEDIPPSIVIDEERTVKIRMPIEEFVISGEVVEE